METSKKDWQVVSGLLLAVIIGMAVLWAFDGDDEKSPIKVAEENVTNKVDSAIFRQKNHLSVVSFGEEETNQIKSLMEEFSKSPDKKLVLMNNSRDSSGGWYQIIIYTNPEVDMLGIIKTWDIPSEGVKTLTAEYYKDGTLHLLQDDSLDFSPKYDSGQLVRPSAKRKAERLKSFDYFFSPRAGLLVAGGETDTERILVSFQVKRSASDLLHSATAEMESM